MNKAFKKGFAALLSVMMIVCFMPAMAFADGASTAEVYKSHEWAKDYSSVTVTYKDGKTAKFDVKRTFNKTTGLIEAEAQKTVIESDTIGIPDQTIEVPDQVTPVYYYDFDGAKTKHKVDGAWTDISSKKNMTYAAYTSLDLSNFNVQLLKPSYAVKDAGETAPVYSEIQNGAFHNLTITATAAPKLEKVPAADTTVTISYEVTAKSEANGSENAPEFVNASISPISFTVKGEAPVEADATKDYVEKNAKIDFDSIKKTAVTAGTLTTKYDGEAHKVVAEQFKGWTSAFEVFNNKTGHWEAKDISFTDVQKENQKFKLVYTNTKTGQTVTKEFEANLEKAKAFFTFDDEQSISKVKGDFEYAVEDTEYNALDYIVVTPAAPADEADTKAVTANESALMDYFAAAYDVNVKPQYSNEKNPEEFNITIKEKAKADKEAADTKYEALLKNFEVTKDGTTAKLAVNVKGNIAVIVDEVTYTQGTTPVLKFVVREATQSHRGGDWKLGDVIKDFDQSVVKFTTAGGQALDKVKPGTYDLDATAEHYVVRIVTGKVTVKAKAVKKVAQKLTVKTKAVTVKANAKKTKKAFTVKPIVKVTGAKGKVSYKKVSGNSKLTVNAKTGKVTVKKGTKKGTYKVKIKVSAAAKGNYKAASKTVTVTVKVK